MLIIDFAPLASWRSSSVLACVSGGSEMGCVACAGRGTPKSEEAGAISLYGRAVACTAVLAGHITCCWEGPGALIRSLIDNGAKSFF